MSSFTAASAVSLHYLRQDNAAVYSATIDPTWGINRIPHGGYLIAILLRAATAFQSDSPLDPSLGTLPPPFGHTQPLTLSAQFLRQTDPGPAEVHVSVVHSGTSATHLQLKLLHHTGGDSLGECTIEAQAVFVPPAPLDASGAPLATSAAASPLLTHPSKLKLDRDLEFEGSEGRWTKKPILGMVREGLWDWVVDPVIEGRRTGEIGRPGGRVLEAGAWCKMLSEEDALHYPILGFLSDVAACTPELLSPGQRPDLPRFPTVSITLQFHAPLPVAPPCLCDPYTAGVYGPGGNGFHDGLHKQRSEVWTAPGPVGSGEEQERWRERSVSLVTSTQVAMTSNGADSRGGQGVRL